MKLTYSILKDLKEKADKATPGPWQQHKENKWLVEQSMRRTDVLPDGHLYVAETCGLEDQMDTNSAFIATANPEVVRALVECIEDMKEVLQHNDCFSEIEEKHFSEDKESDIKFSGDY